MVPLATPVLDSLRSENPARLRETGASREWQPSPRRQAAASAASGLDDLFSNYKHLFYF